MIARFPRYAAFTLAEVLIVLTIIGVVAALTIPALMQKTQDQEFKSALKKEVAALQQTFQKAQSENGGPYLCTYITGSPYVSTDCPQFWADIKSNLNVVKECYGSTLGNCLPEKGVLLQDGQDVGSGCTGFKVANQNNAHVYVLNDGATIFIYNNGSGVNGYFSIFAIDVNGIKPPNQWRKDVFSFYINDNKFDYDACSSGPGPSAREILMGN